MEQVKPGVWLVTAENRGRFPYAHSLYLEGDRNILIDTGAGRNLTQLAGRVDQVFLTHFHRDHVTRNDLFPDADFLIHPLDAPGVESAEGFYRLSGMDRFPGGSYWELVSQARFAPTAVTGHFTGGQRFDLGAATLQVLHTPGHTPGHCAFMVEEYGLIFAADIDLTSFGPWYGNTSSDPEAFRRSIQLVRDLKPDLLLTSHHMPVTENIDARLAGYSAVIDRREALICKHLTERPLTLEQLTDYKLIFGRHPRPEDIYRFFEGNMVRLHLQSMERRGLVRRQGGSERYEAL